MKILKYLIASSIIFSSPGFAYLSDDEPIIVTGTIKTFEDSANAWVQFSSDDFEKVLPFTSPTYKRQKHKVALIHAYGIGNEMFEYSDSKMKKSFYDKTMNFGSKYFIEKESSFYCTHEDNAGFLHCLIFRDIENKLGEKVRLGYNSSIIESGLSEVSFPSSSNDEYPTKVERLLNVAQDKAEKAKVGIWSLKFNFLPDDF